MNTIGMTFDQGLAPCGCLGAPRTRVRTRLLTTPESSRAVEDPSYTLLNERGEPVGIILAPECQPVLGKSAPTFYLKR